MGIFEFITFRWIEKRPSAVVESCPSCGCSRCPLLTSHPSELLQLRPSIARGRARQSAPPSLLQLLRRRLIRYDQA